MRLAKFLSILCFCMTLSESLSSCDNSSSDRIVPDYATAASFESALNKSEDTISKTVCFVVETIKTNSAFGFNIWAGEHLNFISDEDPGVKEEDSMTVRVKEVKTLLGSYLIKYDLIYIN